MTDDYKEQLLNYVTSNLNIESGTNTLIINEDDGISQSNHAGFIHYMLVEEGYSTSGEVVTGSFEELGKISFTNTDKILIYGNMSGQFISNKGGSIIIADSNYNYLDYIAEFDTGTKFREFSVLKSDENNQVYGIDYDSENYQERFLLLNDIIGSYNNYGEYKCTLRKSYNFPSSYNLRNINIYDMYKKYESSNYLFIGQESITAQNFIPTLITLEINVGEENVWNKYTTNDNIDMQYALGTFCIWQNETLELKFGCPSFSELNYYEFEFNGTTLSRTKTIGVSGIYDIEMLDDDVTYIIKNSIVYIDDNPYAKITFQQIIENNLVIINEETIPGELEVLSTYVTNNLLFVLIRVKDGHNRVQKIELIHDGNFYSNEINNLVNIKQDFYVSNYFNLYKMYYSGRDPEEVSIYPTTRIGSSSLDFNIINYNGEPYKSYNSLIPHKGTLYDENGIIFSRNLYNKTILNNTTTSVLEIPNTMLNNTNIVENNLISETNLKLVQNNNIFTKNVYETVFLNFINTINVINEDTNTNYPFVANYVNNNINTGTETNYNNTQCTKYRINYSDNTTVINPISWLPINKFNKVTNISIYVNKEIESIDLLSNDETTVYLNIPVQTEVGKYYTISQKIRTGNKPKAVQLNYNNENINYNNDPVMVYTEEV